MSDTPRTDLFSRSNGGYHEMLELAITLELELAEATAMRDEFNRSVLKLSAENTDQQLEIKRVKDAMRKYGSHKIECPRNYEGREIEGAPCTCGFTEAMEACK